MKKLIAAVLMVSALVFALPASAGSRCDASADECIEKMKTKLAEKAWLGIEYDKADYAGQSRRCTPTARRQMPDSNRVTF